MIALALLALQMQAAVPKRPMADAVTPRRPVVGVAGHPYLAGPPRTVVVDAGHGGVDPGMSGPIGARHKIYEKDITLAVALKLGAALKARGVDVVYTRTTDTLINLYDRGPDRQPRARRSVHLDPRERRQSQMEGCRGGPRLRDVLPLRGEDGGRAARGGDGKLGGPLRDRPAAVARAIRSASSSTTCSRTSTCASR